MLNAFFFRLKSQRSMLWTQIKKRQTPALSSICIMQRLLPSRVQLCVHLIQTSSSFSFSFSIHMNSLSLSTLTLEQANTDSSSISVNWQVNWAKIGVPCFLASMCFLARIVPVPLKGKGKWHHLRSSSRIPSLIMLSGKYCLLYINNCCINIHINIFQIMYNSDSISYTMLQSARHGINGGPRYPGEAGSIYLHYVWTSPRELCEYSQK